jgi:hypothetical protein
VVAKRSTRTGFTRPVLEAFRGAKMLKIRSGKEHRYLGIWVVVVKDRVFVRPWNDKPDGWRRAFLEQPRGEIRLPDGREIRVRARSAHGERLWDAVDAAYAEKYPTPGSRRWVVGFAEPARRATTMELRPR